MAVDKTIFYITIALITIGIVFSYSLSTYATANIYGTSQFFFLIRQLVVGFFSIFVMWVLSRLDPDRWFQPLGFFLFFLFLFLMTIMHFLPSSLVTAVGGAKRWIQLPHFSLAPVEFFKVGFLFFLAWSFSRKFDTSRKSLSDELKLFMPYVFAFGIVVYLIAIMQNDIGQVIVLGSALVVMVFMAGTSTRFFMLSIVAATVVFIVAIVTSEHRVLRIKYWWSSAQNFILSFLPDSLANILRVKDVEEAYQTANSLYAIKHGGLLGTGLGNGTIKLGFLTEVHTDFVLAGIAEEIGLVGVLAIIGLFFVLIYRIFRIANRSTNKIYSLFALGIGIMLATSLFINAFGITGLTPVKGLAVPFVSYGGSSLLAHAIAIGMVLMISKRVEVL